MVYAIYDEDTNLLSCTFDTDSGEFTTYGKFQIKEYGDNIAPVIDIVENEEDEDDYEAYLVQDAFVLFPDNYGYREGDEEE